MDYIKISMEELMKWLKDHLSEKRYIHSIGTAECARDLAKKFGLSKMFSKRRIDSDYQRTFRS